MKHLLDTNIIIDYAKGKQSTVDYLESLAEIPSVSVISVTEIIQGVRDKERPFFKRMFEVWEVLPITHDVALLAGEYRLKYFKSHNLGLADAYIAATSEIFDRSLATLNLKDFPMFKTLKRPYEV